MTRAEHKAAYEAHSARASKLLSELLSAHVMDGVFSEQKKLGKLTHEYHDELTAASAHLALAMLLSEVDAG